MLRVYGVCHHSMASVFDSVSKLMRRCKTQPIMIDLNGIQLTPETKADYIENIKPIPILLFDGLLQFKTLMPELNEINSVALVFGSPLLLNELKGISFLDCKHKNDFSYVFQPIEMDLDDLVKSARNKTNGIHKKDITFEKINIIPKLIEGVKSGKFLHVFNQFLYKTANLANRTILKKTIVEYLFTNMALKTMIAECEPYVPKGKATQLFKEIVEFLKSDEGNKFRVAVKEAKHSKDNVGKHPNFAKIANKHGVDSYELNYFLGVQRLLDQENAVSKN